MDKYDERIALLRQQNREDEEQIKAYEAGNSISTLFSGLADDESHEQARLFKALIASRSEMIAFYERLKAKGA